MPRTKVKKTNENTPEHIKAYLSHGVQFDQEGSDEWKGDCPFCGGSAFFVNVEEGVFHCKTCPEQGNKYTFLQRWYDLCLNKTTQKHYEDLAKDRKLPWEAFEMAEYAWDKTNKKWLIPVRNAKGSMVNLGTWSPTLLINGARPMLQTGGCKLHLGNADRIGDSSQIYVLEGQWDCAAMEWFLHANKIKNVACVWVPGCSTFKEEWATEHFQNKDVTLLYDNDDPGYLGMERATEVLRQHGKCHSLRQIKWPESYPEKFDIRDYIGKNRTRLKRGLSELENMLDEVKFKAPKKHSIERTTFKELVEDYKEAVHVSPEMIDGLLISLSVIFSQKIFSDPYCPLWVYIIAPPGKGKTLIFQTCSDSEEVQFETTLTPKTLISGYKTPDGSDPSLLPQLIGRTLIIEDFTGIMNLPSGEQDEIYGVLRSAYNGRYEKQFGHIGLRVYPEPGSGHETCHFAILAGCTGAIHADKRANQGERFLKFHMSSPDYDPVPQVRAAITNTIEEVTPETVLREPVSAFIDYKLANIKPPAAVPEWVVERCIGLAQLVATIRAVVLRNKGELVVRPESEIATRISKQLVKLGQAIAFTLDKDEIDEEVYRLMQRVGMDTCYGWHRDALVPLCANDEPMKTEEISRNAIMARTTAFRCMEDLLELKAVTFDLEQTGQKGKPAHLWYPTKLTRDLWEQAKIDPELMSYKPMGKGFKRKTRKVEPKGKRVYQPVKKKTPNHSSPSFPRKKTKAVPKKITRKGVKKVKRIAGKKK